MPELGFFDSLVMYGTNINPKFFTDITIPDIKFYSPHTGKKSEKYFNHLPVHCAAIVW